MEKKTHTSKVIAQWRFVSTFIKTYTALHAPEQTSPTEIVPDTYDSEWNQQIDDRDTPDNEDTLTTETAYTPPQKTCRVQIQTEDYGSGISMLHYGHTCPSADYFNSNLMIQNLVVADISNSRNNVYFNDERGQGKNANFVCSLRLLYHLSNLKIDLQNGAAVPEICLSLLDNCVGQNKTKAVMMFFAMLSIISP